MSPTGPAVPFSNLSATVYFKKRNSLKKMQKACVNHGPYLRDLNKIPLKKNIDSGTMEPEVLKC